MLRKYIIIAGQPVLFSHEMQHTDVIGKIAGIESAGYFIISKNKEGEELRVTCLGDSLSLAVGSRPEIDQKIIAGFLKMEQ